MTVLVTSLLLSSALVLGGCSSGSTPSSTSNPAPATTSMGRAGVRVDTPQGAYTNLTPPQLKGMLDNKDFFLVDVHTPPEGRLPKTDARIPFDQIEQQISKFPADKGARIVLACRSGRMSTEASQTLVRLGYTNVYNLDGGMNAWKSAGYDIVPEDK